MVSLEQVKKFLRIEQEYTEDDTLVETMIGAAEAYLQNATGKTFTESKLAILATQIIVTHWYENRGAVLIGSISKELEFSLQSILTQLKYSPREGTAISEVIV